MRHQVTLPGTPKLKSSTQTCLSKEAWVPWQMVRLISAVGGTCVPLGHGYPLLDLDCQSGAEPLGIEGSLLPFPETPVTRNTSSWDSPEARHSSPPFSPCGCLVASEPLSFASTALQPWLPPLHCAPVLSHPDTDSEVPSGCLLCSPPSCHICPFLPHRDVFVRGL